MAKLIPSARFVTEPVVAVLGDMKLNIEGVDAMIEWVRSRAPACLPDDVNTEDDYDRLMSLFPHKGKRGDEVDSDLSDNELLVELAGRKCYNSFGAKAGRKTNQEYIANTQAGDVPHASLLYHAKMSFFIAGVSRRVSHELIRTYVGADRDEEGSPSQESTRYVENAGFYVIPPRYLEGSHSEEARFREACDVNYRSYIEAVRDDLRAHETFKGTPAKGMDYKRILEAGSSLLLHSVETSFVWTTNPMALAKQFKERDNESADLEYQRFAKVWKKLCVDTWPNLFPQPWMQSG